MLTAALVGLLLLREGSPMQIEQVIAWSLIAAMEAAMEVFALGFALGV